MEFDGYTIYSSARTWPYRPEHLEYLDKGGVFYDLAELPEELDPTMLWIAPRHFSYSDLDWSAMRQSNLERFSARFAHREGVSVATGHHGGKSVAIRLTEYARNEKLREVLAALEDDPCMDSADVARIRREAIVEAWSRHYYREVCNVFRQFEHPLRPWERTAAGLWSPSNLQDYFDEAFSDERQLAIFTEFLIDLGGSWEEGGDGMSPRLPYSPNFDLLEMIEELAYRLTDGEFEDKEEKKR